MFGVYVLFVTDQIPFYQQKASTVHSQPDRVRVVKCTCSSYMYCMCHCNLLCQEIKTVAI